MAVTGSPELLIVMSVHATPEEVEHVVERLADAGADAHVTPGREATVIGAIGEREALAALPLEGFPGVEQVLPILKPYKLVSRELSPDPTVIEARGETGLPIVTELMDPRHVDAVLEHADVIQIGARNMQNFNLLSEVGRVDKPVLLKRGPAASIEELLMAAEYVVKEGNARVILCERGITTFEHATRYTLDISAIPVLKHETHLPVIVDPSHAAGRRELVLPLARAAVAAGADGIIVEVHPRPEEALCDGPQQIPTAEFDEFAREVIAVADLTVVAVPVTSLPRSVADVLAAGGNSTVTDVGSTKGGVVRAAGTDA